MSLKFYFHPLSSFCHKALIALYETGAPFDPVIVNLGEEQSRAAFLKIWAGGKFPVLVDEGRGHTIPESTTIIEYLAQNYPGNTALLLADPDRAWRTRLCDRFFDFYMHLPMQKVMGDRLRPEGARDPHGVTEAKAQLRKAYDMIEAGMTGAPWAMGDAFTLADCAAAPALFYGDMAEPFGPGHGKAAAFLDRLKQRPSYARILTEAEPYFNMIPKPQGADAA
jgi:glutathione S-transferase